MEEGHRGLRGERDENCQLLTISISSQWSIANYQLLLEFLLDFSQTLTERRLMPNALEAFGVCLKHDLCNPIRQVFNCVQIGCDVQGNSLGAR